MLLVGGSASELDRGDDRHWLLVWCLEAVEMGDDWLPYDQAELQGGLQPQCIHQLRVCVVPSAFVVKSSGGSGDGGVGGEGKTQVQVSCGSLTQPTCLSVF